MSMYVIYPADELISLLLAREYSVPATGRSRSRSLSVPSPLVPTLSESEDPTPIRLDQNSQEPKSHGRSSKSKSKSKSPDKFSGPSTSEAAAATPPTKKTSKKPPPLVLPIGNNIGVKKLPTKSNPIPTTQTQTPPSITVSLTPPEPPVRVKKTKSWRKQTDKVHPLAGTSPPPSSAFQKSSSSGKLGTGGRPRVAFAFERISEESEGEDDEFVHFRRTNSGGSSGLLSAGVGETKLSPSSPTLSTRSSSFGPWKFPGKSSGTTKGNMAAANSILSGGAVGLTKDTLSSGAIGNLSDIASLKDMLHPTLNESLKAHNALSFKLIRIVSDFTQQLSQLHEQHAVELQRLVENFRKRNAEIRKERPPCTNSLFQVWETMLQEVEIDSQAHSDIAGSLGRQVARQLLEKTFCRKIQSRKIFTHRESFETVLSKAEGLLSNAYREYCEACQLHVQHGNSNTLSQYYEAHNAYVQQLRGTNAMLKEYQSETLPALLQELEDIYMELCTALSDSILQGADIINVRGQEAGRRYEELTKVCRNVNGLQDLRDYVKCVSVIPLPNQRHAFTLPAPLRPDAGDLAIQDQSHVPVLKDEVVQDRLAPTSWRSRHESLKKEMGELESEMRQLQDSLDALIRMQQRSLDSNLFNKANELQEEISMKRFDLRVAQMHLSALKAQRDLYSPRSEGAGGSGGESSSSISSGPRERKMSVASTGSMKSKWLSAFRSLKAPAPAPSPPPPREIFEKKNGKEKDNKESFQIFENHIFQEYTYKKITPCDICSKILRGHTRQGLRCRMCKTNVHVDCQEKVGKCQPKTRLLRRQRSTSELETRLTQLAETDGLPQRQQTTSKPNDEPDLIYQVLKQATDMKKPPGGSTNGSGNGLHGSSQTLHTQQEFGGGMFGAAGPSTGSRRSNPTVNVIGNSSHSGSNTPALAAAQAATFHPSSSDETSTAIAKGQSQRRDSYVSRKSISADADGPPNPALFLLPPPRAVSLPSTQTPHSPRRRKLDLRMKSFSLDSPESTEHAQRRRYAHGSQSTSHSQYWRLIYANTSGIALGGGGVLHSRSRSTPNATYASSSSNQLLDYYSYPQTPTANYPAPSSPVHNRRTLLTARNVRMSSVELPDENDKSLSSASTSPCPSPKPHRLLPTNLYVVLYMFKARHPDELDLKSGNKVTVTDTTDPDWWQGKCMGHTGYFPSKYVTKLHSGERPLQVTHNLQVTDGAENGLKLLRDQIVIQIGEELDGMVTIRNGDNKQGVCPRKYLQEV